MDQKTKKKSGSVKMYLLKNIIFTVLGIVIISFSLIMFTVWGLNSYTRHGQAIEVPAIKGLSVEEAEKVLAKSSLRCEVISSIYTGAKPGTIIEVVPDEKSKVKKDRVVYLVIEPTTPQMISIPDLRSFSSRQALTRLKSLGFDYVTVESRPSSYKGLVLDILADGQALGTGVKVAKSTPITLVVGQGGEVIVDSIFDGLIDPNEDILEMDDFSDTEVSTTDNPYFD